MLLKKILNNKIFILVIFSLVFLSFRIPSLGTDVINPDGVNWHYRSEQFIVGLKTRDLSKTYQHYHPGVTLMWVMGAPIEIVKQLYPESNSYNNITFPAFHFTAKFSLVMSHLVLSVLSIYLLTQILNIQKTKNAFLISITSITLLSLEPFFLGNSRLVHLDVLLTLFLFNGLLLAYLASKTNSFYYYLLTGMFLALAFLTKSIGIGGIIYVLLFTFYVSFKRVKSIDLTKRFLFLGVGFLLFLVLLFPALWGDFFGVLSSIFEEATRIGVRNGHGQIFFGQYTRDPGMLFYLVVYLLKVTPFTVFGTILFIIFKIKVLKKPIKAFSRDMTLEAFLFIFYIGYLVIMMYPTKKIDRYMLPLYPLVTLYSVLGYFQLFKHYEKVQVTSKKQFLLAVLFIFFGFSVLCPLRKLFPYYFTYTSPLFINPTYANNVVGQKPFGVGIPELKNQLFMKYGVYPNIGFIDRKPMAAIYMNSRIFDIRETGTKKYDIIILAINEEMPENVLDGEFTYKHDSSMYINGLEYWRIYVKETY